MRRCNTVYAIDILWQILSLATIIGATALVGSLQGWK